MILTAGFRDPEPDISARLPALRPVPPRRRVPGITKESVGPLRCLDELVYNIVVLISSVRNRFRKESGTQIKQER